MQGHREGAPPIVLDTHVALDWHVFRDARAPALMRALEEGRVRWHASASIWTEFVLVASRPGIVKYGILNECLLTSIQSRWMTLVAGPSDVSPARGPICSDPDDQKFIELAIALPARWLVTRDRALLKLAPAARRLGVCIVTPERWAG